MLTGINKLAGMLLVSVPSDLLDDDVIRLRRDILQAIRQYDSQVVVLDFHLVDICDSFFGRFIYSTSKTVELMGASIIIAGLQDAVIETMVELGMTLPEVDVVIDLDEAMRLTRKRAQTVSSDIIAKIDEMADALNIRFDDDAFSS